jgi:NADH:ubiquinone reductase (H+-translocating)
MSGNYNNSIRTAEVTKWEGTNKNTTDQINASTEKQKLTYSSSLSTKHIVILGSGFAGIEVLKRVQNKFKNNKNIDITLVSRDNFLLFTPMLAEVASGTVETRHIVTPVRLFCKKAKFYEANVESIDLDNKEVMIAYSVGKQSQPISWNQHILKYDYLVITLGSENNFFGMADVQENAFTMTTIDDAIVLRNHIINMLEQANLEQHNIELRKSLLTFVVVGGGFNGVETVGELNHFVRDSVEKYYKNIYMTDIKVILVSATDKILEQVDEELGKFALQKLKGSGVDFIMNHQVKGATPTSAILDDGTTIPCYTLVWSTGVTPSKLIADLPCEHAKGHRIIANNYLEVPGYEGEVYALGDCASITDPHTGKPYPATAQHAIREGKVAAKNILYAIEGKEEKRKDDSKNKKAKFDYKTKGMMAEIGKRTGVAILFGKIKIHGFIAWWLWRTYYLSNLPTAKKKLKVMSDWTSDLFFKSDVAMIKRTQVQDNNNNKSKDREKKIDEHEEGGKQKEQGVGGVEKRIQAQNNIMNKDTKQINR